MKRSLTLLAVLSLAAAPSAAFAGNGHSKHQSTKSHTPAKVLRATLKPVRQDVADYTAFTGKAQFVANKRNAKVSVHVRHMVPRTTYPWAVVTESCDGTAVTGLKYKTLKTGRSGNANSKGYSKKGRFSFDKSATYFVVVYQTGTTEPLLCGELKGKAKKKAAKHHGSSGKGKGKGKAPATTQPPAKGKGKK